MGNSFLTKDEFAEKLLAIFKENMSFTGGEKKIEKSEDNEPLPVADEFTISEILKAHGYSKWSSRFGG